MSNRVLVIGLDGATFDVINPLIKEGRMPNIEKMIKNGASGTLQSTMPPVTGPAWLALGTGLTPGQTGIVDFIKRKKVDDYEFGLMSSADYKGRAVWDYLGDSGRKVGVVNYPTMYPPYAVNGFLIAGGVGSPQLSNFTYPAGLEDKVVDILGQNRQLKLKDPKYEDINLFVNDLTNIFDRRVALNEYLLTEKEWDFCWTVFSETDWIQHRMWNYSDSSHANYKEEIEGEKREQFKQFWGHVDDSVGRLQEISGDNTNIILVSDHGFGPVDSTFRLNRWLIDKGYLKPYNRGHHRFSTLSKTRKVLGRIARWLQINKLAPQLFQWGREVTVPLSIEANSIDYSQTIAFDPGHIGTLGGIYINEQAQNLTENPETVKKKIAEELLDFGKEYQLDIQVLRPEDLYGLKAETSPDLLIRVNDGRANIDKQFEGEIFESKVPDRLSFISGSHRLNGIIIAAGPDFIHTSIEGAHLWDIPATLLYIFKETIPEQIEGRVLDEAMKLKDQEKSGSQESQVSEEENENPLTEDEEEAIKERLRDLGYL